MWRVSIAATALSLLLSVNAFAQNSGVSGTVNDVTNALIPGVTVTVTNIATGVVSTVLTNESGAYNFLSLQPGNYKISASLSGFQTETYNNYNVEPNQQFRLNFTMKVATVAQAVEVTVDAAGLLATSSSSIGTVLTEERVRNLPLVGQDILQLIGIMPGVSGTGAGANFAGVSANSQGSSINTTRDGLSVADGRFQNGVFATTVINPDLVGEVRVILTPVDAELGRGNGQVQITTRSGTNQFRGTAVWNARNTAFNANTWSNNRTLGGATPPNWDNNHDYSISYGGPVKIPGLYDGKNKTFFFALWDQTLDFQRNLITASVMTDAARQGIFRYFDGWNNGNYNTATVTTGTNPIIGVVNLDGSPKAPLTNPTGGAYTGGLRCFSVFGNTKVDGTPFTQSDCPGGTAINGPAWDTFRPALDNTGYIKMVLNAMPKANYFGTGDGLNRAGFRWTLHREGNQGAFVTTGADLGTNRKQLNLKIDHNFSQKHKLSVGYTRERNFTLSDVPNWPGGISYDTHRYPQVLTVNFVSTLSSTLLNEARYGIRYEDAGIDAPWEEQFPDASARKAAQALMLPGSKGYNALVAPGAGNYAFGGGANGIMNTNPGQYNGNKSPLYNYADTLSWTRGKHAFKFGGEYRFTESNGYNNTPAGGGAIILYPRVTGGAGNQTSPLASAITAIPNFLGTNRTDAANMLYFLAGSVNSVSQSYWINSYDDVKNGTWHDTNDLSTQRRKYRPVDEKEWAAFVKDDYKITRNLTLNVGMRWDYYGSPYIPTGFTSNAIGSGAGLFGIGRASGSIFSNWLQPGNIFLTGYGPNASLDSALSCVSGVTQSPLLPTSNCDPNKLTAIQFIGPKTPNSDQTAIKQDWNNFGPAVGFAYQLPWFGEGKTTIRGGYQVTFGGSGRTVGGGGTTASETVVGAAPGAQSSPNTVLSDFSGQYLDLHSIAALVPVRPTSPALPGATIPVYTRATAFSAYDPNYVTPYTENITLSVTRAVRRNVTVDMRYIGTLSKKQPGSYNLNLPDVYYNKELYDALTITRNGGDSPLLDQMLAGLNLNSGTVAPNGLTYGPIGTPVGGVLQTASMHLRRNATFAANLANGNFSAVAASLNGNGSSLPANGTTGGLTNVPAGLAGVGGRLLRNGCDRIASGVTTVTTPSGVLPVRCFAENYISANPQLSAANFINNSSSSNYHSLQAQVTLRPTHGFSYQATYTWAKNLGISSVLGLGGTSAFTDPLNQRGDYSYTNSHRAHDLRTNGTFELPIGPNKLLLGNSSGWLARLVERWQTTFILNLTSGGRSDITAGTLFYGNPVPDAVVPFSLTKGNVVWGDSSDANGQLQGSYFGAGTYVKVRDPQCSAIDVTDKMGWNLGSAANNLCTIDALQDAKTGKIVLQNPQPGRRGNLGQNSIELPGSWRFDANASKAFRINETKSLQFRIDATNVLNHPDIGTPSLNLTNSTNFGQITTKGNSVRNFQAQMRFTF